MNENLYENFSFLELNEIAKIEKNGYAITVSQCTDINHLKKLSKVKDVSQETFDIYASAVNSFIDEDKFFLNEKIDKQVKKEVIKLARNRKDYSFIIDNPMMEIEQLKFANTLKNCGYNPELASDYCHKNSKKDDKYLENIKKAKIKSDDFEKLIKKGYALSTISGYADGLKDGIDTLKYLEGNCSCIDKTSINMLVSIIKNDENFDSRNYKFYFKKPLNTWEILNRLEKYGIDITKMHEKMFNKYCLKQLCVLFDKGVDITKYMSKEYNFRQLACISEGIDGGVDVSLYDNNCYDYNQMDVIRKALRYNQQNEEKIDASIICNALLSSFEMQNIVYILKKGTLDQKLFIMKKYGKKEEKIEKEICKSR